MASSVQRVTKRPRIWHAWAGSADQLERIGAVVADLVERRKESLVTKYLEDHPAPPDRETEQAQEHSYFPYTTHKAVTDAAIRDIEAACQFRASLTDRTSDEATGDLESIFAEFDRRTYRKIIFYCSFGGHEYVEKEKLLLTMERDTEEPGVRLVVESADPGWAKQASAEISEEVDKGSQRWGIIHSPFGMVGVTFVLWMLLATLIYLLTTLANFDWFIRSILVTIISLIVALGLMLIELTYWWMFPSMQILADGERSSGVRGLGYIALLLLTTVIAVAVNTIK
ncbi:hypothetical protein [Kribbella sp. CA-293567]|uniref:hypothetical protein n=1 Tax=Kribbella sp. CA-293567 TaxID=3002436 RepID=UPI0022DDC1B5|nr:hypothetical protein [Kribbella sp. CA-293567]WBQ05781.1 hypothetical protein OX958_03010 [Kribbella sp. CA-293567]